MTGKLIRLEIPAGWAINHNHFVDSIPIQNKEDDILENWFNFTENLLQISKLSNESGVHIIPKRHLLIDLGWYPDSDFNGEYKLNLVFIEPDSDLAWNCIKEFSSKDRFVIRNKIEEWLEKLVFIDNNSKTKNEIMNLLEDK